MVIWVQSCGCAQIRTLTQIDKCEPAHTLTKNDTNTQLNTNLQNYEEICD